MDWWPWGDEAWAEAERRDVPVLVSVGYAACHWCHVMADTRAETGKSDFPQVRGGVAVPDRAAG